MKMNYSITSTSYIIEKDGVPRICLFCRDENFKKAVFKCPYFPYFYLDVNQIQNVLDYLYRKYPALYKSILRVNPEVYRGDFGAKVKKVIVNVPSSVRAIRKALEQCKRWRFNTYEADVLFHLRFLIDANLKSGFECELNNSNIEEDSPIPVYNVRKENLIPKEVESRLHIGFIDIEVYVKTVQEMKFYKAPVIIVGIFNYTTKEFIQFTDEKEYELLIKVRDYLRKEQFDLLVSFSPFDMDYLLRRMETILGSIKELSPIGRVSVNNEPKILGTEIVDYAKVYRQFKGEPTWNTLDFIGKKELGYGKLKLEKETVYETWKVNKQNVLEYNERDLRLLVALEDKLQILKNFINPIRKIVGCNFNDVNYPNRLGDILYLRLNHGKTVFLSRSPHKFIGYLGALILDLKPGIYENILVLDFSELYPSIIESFNIGWNTYNPEFGHVKIGDAKFVKDEESWTTTIMRDLRRLRKEVKEQIKKEANPVVKQALKARSMAFKSVINSCYGSFGYAGYQLEKHGKEIILAYNPSRFYSPIIAGAITQVGRILLKESVEEMGKIGYKVIFGDTDSLFIQMKTNNNEEVQYIKGELEKRINEVSKRIWNVNVNFDVEIDKVFKKIILPAKKRYHGITVEGEEEIKGLEIVRKNVADKTVSLQLQIGRMILQGESKEEILKVISTEYVNVLKGNIPIAELLPKGKCQKKEYQVKTHYLKAVTVGNKLFNQNIEFGERFYWCYIKGVKVANLLRDSLMIDNEKYDLDIIGLKQPIIPDSVVVDYERMAEHVIIKPLRRYTELLGISISDLKETFKPKALDSYFKVQ